MTEYGHPAGTSMPTPAAPPPLCRAGRRRESREDYFAALCAPLLRGAGRLRPSPAPRSAASPISPTSPSAPRSSSPTVSPGLARSSPPPPPSSLLTGILTPCACARYGLDMDLITRVPVFWLLRLDPHLADLRLLHLHSFFFGARSSIMAGRPCTRPSGCPSRSAYLVTTLIVIPIVFRGMGALAAAGMDSSPWTVGLAALSSSPSRRRRPVGRFASFGGTEGPAPLLIGFGPGTVALLIAQIGEQAEYLRLHAREDRGEPAALELAVLPRDSGCGHRARLSSWRRFLASSPWTASARPTPGADRPAQIEALRPAWPSALPAAASFVIVSLDHDQRH